MQTLSEILALGQKYISSADPLAMIYFVTKACNCTCAHCFYWESLNKPRPRELTLDEIDRIADSIGKLLYLRISGGEPFIRKDFFDIVKLFTEKCRPSYIGIPSNGFYGDRMISFAERARELPVLIEIGISIDDLGEHHDRIRGPKNLFHTAIQTFKTLQKVKTRSSNLNVGFIVTAMKSNQEHLPALFDFLKELGPDGIACNFIRDDTKVKEEKEIEPAAVYQFAALCEEYNQRSSQKENWFSKMRQGKTFYAHQIREETVKTNQFQIPCVAGNKIVVMYSEGEVHPCETLGFEIGNIRDFGYDLKKLLASQRAKEIREKIIKEKCFCTHECFTSASIVFSARQMAKVAFKSLSSK